MEAHRPGPRSHLCYRQRPPTILVATIDITQPMRQGISPPEQRASLATTIQAKPWAGRDGAGRSLAVRPRVTRRKPLRRGRGAPRQTPGSERMLRDDETSVDTLRRRPRRHRHPTSRGAPRATPGPWSATCRTTTTNRPDCRCAHAERRRTRPARQSAGNDHREDVETPAAGCDRHAPAPTSSTTLATCRPSLPKLLDTPNPAIRPRTGATRLRCPRARPRPAHTH